jgi:type I restriction enzyme R subunit
VQYVGEHGTLPTVKVRSGGGSGEAPPVKKVSVQDMITEIRARYPITDEEALYIREVTEETAEDTEIRDTVQGHKEDLRFLRDVFKDHVNQQIQGAYAVRQLYEELGDPKYIEPGAIFDIMAYTVVQQHLAAV